MGTSLTRQYTLLHCILNSIVRTYSWSGSLPAILCHAKWHSFTNQHLLNCKRENVLSLMPPVQLECTRWLSSSASVRLLRVSVVSISTNSHLILRIAKDPSIPLFINNHCPSSGTCIQANSTTRHRDTGMSGWNSFNDLTILWAYII